MSKYSRVNRVDNNRLMNNSPSASNLTGIDKANSSKKKRNLVHGISNGSIGKQGMMI